MALGFVGTLISGAVADRLATRGISVLWVSPVFVLVFLVIEALLMAGVTRSPPVLAFAFGMFGQSAILLYPWLASYFGGAHAAGRSNAALNLLSFGGLRHPIWLRRCPRSLAVDQGGSYDPQAIAPPSPSASPRRRWRSCGFSPPSGVACPLENQLERQRPDRRGHPRRLCREPS